MSNPATHNLPPGYVTIDDFITELRINYEVMKSKYSELEQRTISLEKENTELKFLLEGANQIHNKIAILVGDRGQYRDLVEAVEMKLHSLNYGNP